MEHQLLLGDIKLNLQGDHEVRLNQFSERFVKNNDMGDIEDRGFGILIYLMELVSDILWRGSCPARDGTGKKSDNCSVVVILWFRMAFRDK